MRIEFRVKQILEELNQPLHGAEQRIASTCGLHRHTVGKILRNEAKNPSLEVLEKICRYLIDHGADPDKLPGALFAVRPSGLWEAIGLTENVTIFLGMYKHSEKGGPAVPAPMSIARHDASVVAKFIRQLSSKEEMGSSRPQVRTRYVPFMFSPGMKRVQGAGFEEDKKRVQGIFKELMSAERSESAILVGSQRANYLVECLVARLFRCEPFKPVTGDVKVPFYLCYRDYDWPVPSCFGGRVKPPGLPGEARWGTFYLDEEWTWNLLPFEQEKSDAGIVITIKAGTTFTLATFGFSGRATCALGNVLIHQSEKFWPQIQDQEQVGNPIPKPLGKKGNGPPRPKTKRSSFKNLVQAGGKEIGIYMCKVIFARQDDLPNTWEEEDLEGDAVEVIPLPRAVLERFLN